MVMNIRKIITRILMTVGILVGVLTVFGIWYYRQMAHPMSVTSERMRRARLALEAYYREYGRIPEGTLGEVMRILSGYHQNTQNPKEIPFYPWTPDRDDFNAKGDWVDEWGTPFLLVKRSERTLVLRSWGKNKRDDGGQFDDKTIVVELEPE